MNPFIKKGRSIAAPPRRVELLLFLRSDAEADAAVERHAIELHVEALAVLVLPCGAYPREESFAALAIADLVGDVAGAFRAGGFIGFGGCVSHWFSPSFFRFFR